MSLLNEFLNHVVEHFKPQPLEIPLFLEVNNFNSIVDDANNNKSNISIRNFQLTKVLGQGSFGKVYLVRLIASPSLSRNSDESCKEAFAMKVLRKKDVMKLQQVEHTLTERMILERITHPFILSLKFAFQTNEK